MTITTTAVVAIQEPIMKQVLVLFPGAMGGSSAQLLKEQTTYAELHTSMVPVPPILNWILSIFELDPLQFLVGANCSCPIWESTYDIGS